MKLNHSKLIDRYNRNLNYLRISITDRCNLRCQYCVPRQHIPKMAHEEILRYEEILRIVGVGVGLGISKIRVTGGEPLVRKGVYGFLAALTATEGVADVSLTTNGVLLKDHIERILAAGIRRINVSLDTLKPDKYRLITGRDRFHQVWEGIQGALERGFDPIKLNAVAMGGVNDDELLDLARLSFDYPFHIRFIEYMPMGLARVPDGKPLLAPEIKSRLSALGTLHPVAHQSLDGPAERYRFDGALGEIGLIRPISHHFCQKCNRLRLTAAGRLRPCLLSDQSVDLRGPLRRGCRDDELAAIFLQAVRTKPFQHQVAARHPAAVSAQMCAIGG